MNQFNHKFKKSLGQNFITDNNIIKKIVDSVELTSNDLVIEIGPGAGVLTRELIKKCRVLAYEVDISLKEKLCFDTDNLEIIWDDFLKRNLKQDISKYKYNKLYVIANIPYYITTPIVEKIIDETEDIEEVIIMVQKEVGDRFSAKPKTKEYGSLTVYLNYYYDISKVCDVSRKCFYPEPNVDSVVISLKNKKNKENVKDIDLFFKLVIDSFQFKRKTLRNNLKSYDLEKIEEILKKHNLDLSVRAEALPLSIFVEISNNL